MTWEEAKSYLNYVCDFWHDGHDSDYDAEPINTMEKIMENPIEWLRALTTKPSKNATQREKNIYRSANALLAALEDTKKEDCQCECHKYSVSKNHADGMFCPHCQ